MIASNKNVPYICRVRLKGHSNESIRTQENPSKRWLVYPQARQKARYIPAPYKTRANFSRKTPVF